MSQTCPCCGHVFQPPARRVCHDCGRPMSNHHKWTLQPRGADGILTPVHRNCDDPEAYVPDLAHPAVKAMRRKTP